ncbi:hypothetical protein MP228_010167 [Amoeboaphelidium protococcarum]|nr:hypothetical protein MP228_010167 [Amoeboaphelidium protococcarum]
MIRSKITSVIQIRTYAKAAAAQQSGKSSAGEETKKQIARPSRRQQWRQKADQWLNSPEAQQYNRLSSRNWLHPKRPFPSNPWFVPETPVDDKVKEAIYQDYASNPLQTPVRKLALKYDLSVIRVEAILRMKHLEKKQAANGYVLQKTFSKKMELMLGVGDQPRLKEHPDLREYERVNTRPLFVMSSDEDNEDSSSENGKSSSQSIKAGVVQDVSLISSKQLEKMGNDKFLRRKDGNYILPLSGIAQEPEEPVQIIEKQNPRETNLRWKFMISDVSPGTEAQAYVSSARKTLTEHTDQELKQMENQRWANAEEKCAMMVRDNDGTLRTATKEERRMHLELFPLRSATAIAQNDNRRLWQV